MLRRWIIRSLCIALLTLCVTAWVGSYSEYLYVESSRKTGSWSWSLGAGELYCSVGSGRGNDRTRWRMGHERYGWFQSYSLRFIYPATPYHLLGFAWEPHRPPKSFGYLVMIPLWFPTTLSAGFLWLAWRKTRQKYSGKGFPVEIGDQPTNA